MKKTFLISAVSLIVILIVFSFALGRRRIFTDSRISMDTIVSISVVSTSRSAAQSAMDKAFAEVDRIGDLVNFYSDKSEIARINKNAGIKPVHVSPTTLELVKKAVGISKMTGGAFDPTIGAISILWDFHKKIKPEDRDIRSRLKLVSWKDVIINEKKETVFLKKKGMMLDPGGITKGFAADKAVEILKANRIKAALVAAAGDIRAYGVKPDGNPWRIGVQDPRPVSPTENILGSLPLRDKAISTSGDYQRFMEIEGVRYHHLLDPKTGMPARGCESVTVIADGATITDPVATGVFVLGPDNGLALLKKLGYEGLIVDSEGKIHMTEGLSKIIEIRKHTE